MTEPDHVGTQHLDAEELFEHAPTGYVITDGNWKVLRVNQTLLDWLDLLHEDLAGRHFSELLTPPGRIYHETHYAPLVLHQNHVSEVAADMLRKSGPAMPALLSSRARGSGHARSIRTSVVRTEERRRYEQELLAARRRAEHSEARTKALHEAVSQLVGANTEAEVTASLQLAVRALPGALDASAWLVDATGELREAGRHRNQPRRLSATADHPAALCHRERRVVVDGRTNILAVPLTGHEPHGVFTVALTSMDETTEEDRGLVATLAAQAGQALDRITIHERREQILHAAAHDLHLPLTIIVGHAASLGEMLEDRVTPGEAAALERVISVADRMRSLVADYLELARIEEGHTPLALEPTDVAVALRGAIAIVRPRATLEGVTFGLDDAGAAMALADPGALEIALTNLLADAVTLTPRTEEIAVGIIAGESTIGISIHDLGTAPRAEGDWVQASASDVPSRSAIGIAVARGMVEAMGGRLLVEEGSHGGIVEIHLPRA